MEFVDKQSGRRRSFDQMDDTGLPFSIFEGTTYDQIYEEDNLTDSEDIRAIANYMYSDLRDEVKIRVRE